MTSFLVNIGKHRATARKASVLNPKNIMLELDKKLDIVQSSKLN